MKTPNNYDRKMFMHPECFSSPLVHAFVLNFAQLFRDINQVDFNLRSNNVSNFSANQKKKCWNILKSEFESTFIKQRDSPLAE